MIKKITHLAILTIVALSCGTAFGQNFTFVQPFNFSPAQVPNFGPIGGVNGTTTFDISDQLGFGANSGAVILGVTNGFTNNSAGGFTVDAGTETTFTLSGTQDVLATVSHGSFLGAPAPGGPVATDGVRSTSSFQLVSGLDLTEFSAGAAAAGGGETDFFVEYVGPFDGAPAQNQIAGVGESFLFESTEVVDQFTVFTTNGAGTNAFSIGFAPVGVPEPASGLLLAFATGLVGLRRRRS